MDSSASTNPGLDTPMAVKAESSSAGAPDTPCASIMTRAEDPADLATYHHAVEPMCTPRTTRGFKHTALVWENTSFQWRLFFRRLATGC